MGKLIRAQVPPRSRDLVFGFAEQGVVHHLPSGLPLVVQVKHLKHISPSPGQLLIADRIDVQLIAGNVLGLRTFGGLEVDDRRLAGVQLCDQVDPAVDRDPRRDADLGFPG